MQSKTKTTQNGRSLNILLSNGRFPVAIDLARQFKRAGHTVYVVDPMHYHVCKFSNVVKKSFQVAAPHEDAAGYVAGVKNAIKEKQIDLIVPLHEEILYLAESGDQEIIDRLFAPPLPSLVRLHNKWHFTEFLRRLGVDYPQSSLCRNMDDVRMLDRTKEWALKPVFGRAAAKVYHLKPEEPLPDVDVSNDEHYIAQEWLYGLRYCSYSVIRDGKLRALSIYPVKDTLDGSSCVYFDSAEHAGIRAYVEKIAAAHPGVSCQLAFDFIETKDGRLVAIECNPRATSGIHLFSGHRDLARIITETEVGTGEVVIPREKSTPRKIAPGMLMVPLRSHANVKEYLSHLKRLVKSRDVTFSAHDVLPSVMQPFLVTSYYKICQEKGGGLNIATMFQMDLVWEPSGEHLEKVRTMLNEMEESEEGPRDENNGANVAVGPSEGDERMPHDDVQNSGSETAVDEREPQDDVQNDERETAVDERKFHDDVQGGLANGMPNGAAEVHS